MEMSPSLPAVSRRVTRSLSNTVGHSLRLPPVYDFESDDEDNVYAEEIFEAVLPLCANFDSLTREDAGR